MHLSGTIEYAVFAGVVFLATAFIVLRFSKVRSARRLLVLTSLGIVIILAGGIRFVQDAESEERQRIRSQLEGFAPTYAAEMEHLEHWKIKFDSPGNDPVYLSAIEAEKRWLKANPGIADVYTFRKNADGKLAFVVDSETDYDHDGKFSGDRESRTAIGEVYEEENNLLTDALADHAGFGEEPYTDRWGTWVSAAVPIHGPDGSVDAVLGVDYPADAWTSAIASVRHQHITQLGIVAVLLLSALSVISLQRKGLEEKHRTAEILEEQKEELKQAHDQAEQANQAKGEFVTNVSHQLRGPLTSILTTAELLQAPNITAAERTSQLQTLQRNGEHLLSLVDDLIELGQIESGNLNFEVSDVNLPLLFEEVASMAAPQLKDRTFSIEYRTPIHRAIRTDGKRLRQVLLNLAENAANLGNCSGIALELNLSGPRLRMDVRAIQACSDHCAFIPDIESQSLGLRLSTQLARMLGGTLKAPGNPEKPYSLEIPANPVPGSIMVSQRPLLASTSTSNANPDAPHFKGIRILVADDSTESQKLIEFMLKGASLELVSNGREAVGRALLASAENKPYDLIMLDIQMPIMDGLEAAGVLREKGYLHPLLAITTDASAAERARYLARGFNDLISRPLNRRSLMEKVQAAVKRRRAA